MKTPPFRYAYPHPAVTTDIVVFSIRDGRPQLLLVRRRGDPFKGQWALPGGFLAIDEDLEDCARRELKEETGLSGIDLEQFHTFGRPGRDPRERVVSVAYLALVSPAKVRVVAASDAAEVAWFHLAGLPPLAFDHAEIVRTAEERLMSRLDARG